MFHLGQLARLGAFGWVLLLLSTTSTAQFDYTLTMDVEQRTWSVEGRFSNPGGGDLEYWIARWTPGAYHVADYGKGVGSLVAEDGTGVALRVERVDDSHWRIATHGAAEVVVRYTARSLSQGFYDQVLDVEANRITSNYAYLTPVSLFGFVPGRVQEPYSLRVELPVGWEVGTVLSQDSQGIYHAPSYYRFEDSPLLFSPGLTTVRTEAGGKPLDISVHGRSPAQIRELVDGCVRIVEAAAAMMGGLPYERYHFLLGYVPEAQGSGLEHSDSTLILLSPGLASNHGWGLIAHEFIHLWCAERIHVEAIHEPDYSAPLVTGTIWVNESITEYLAKLVLLHARLATREWVLQSLGAPDAVLELQVANLPSPTDISRAAVHWGGLMDLFAFSLKMYQHGPRIMFALDMEMRRASEGERGVLDLVRHLLQDYAVQGRGFPEDGMLEAINKVAGGDLTDFYRAYIDGQGSPDSIAALDALGYAWDGERVVSSPVASPTQLSTRTDFFSIDGR